VIGRIRRPPPPARPDGMGPLYREACRDDLGAIIERATHALIH
jgi:hypothetical protein